MTTKIAVLSILSLFVAVHTLSAQTGVVINEIMYAPQSPEPEWIELFNTDSTNVDIAGWQISTTAASVTLPIDLKTADQFSHYIIITTDSMALRVTRPGNYLIVQCALPSLDSLGQKIVLKNASLQTVDSLYYRPSWGGSNGRSLERINALGPSTDSANWGTSIVASGATPGAQNSLTGMKTGTHDLALDSLQHNFLNDTLTISVRVVNQGTLLIDSSELTIESDTGNGPSPIFTTMLDTLDTDSSIIEYINLPYVSYRPTNYTLYITSAFDTTHGDDTLRFNVPGKSNALSIVMNEIMVRVASPEPQWIELLNTTPDTINIAGWSLTVLGHSPVVVPSMNAVLPPDSMVILSGNDTALAQYRKIPVEHIIQISLPHMDYGGSTLALRDPFGDLIDTVSYAGTWIKTDGISIERIDPSKPGDDPSNWAACGDSSGSTILRPNSVRRRGHDIALLSVDGVNEVDTSVIFSVGNLGRDTSRSVTIRLQIDTIDTVTSVIPVFLPPDTTVQVLIPIPQNFFGLFHGIAYLLDSLNAQTSNDTIHFRIVIPVPLDSLVLNEVMFDPQPTGCEWLELYNRSSRWISLDSARLVTGEKRPGEYSHAVTPLLIPPDSFGIIAADSSLFYQTYPSLTHGGDVAGLGISSLDLGRDSCFLTLHNPDSTTIDSVHYFKTWQQSLLRKTFVGISLERIDPAGESNDPRNWQACIDTSGATPLARNSIASSNSDTASPPLPAGTAFNASFSPNPFSPDGDGFQDATTLTIQTGDATSAWAMRVRIYDARGVMVRMLSDAATIIGATALSFDGKRDNGQTLPPGLYAVLIELTSQSPLRTLKQAIGVVIAGRRR
ncbi:MAG TPA: lamin tail domain-containing protein [Candidatus Kapabacteria bacterium]|nr:lamin tail domain-containing protein [Candidatus Kapabacteria bacterium]